MVTKLINNFCLRYFHEKPFKNSNKENLAINKNALPDKSGNPEYLKTL